MIYKIIGETGRARCSCSHRVKAREDYYIFTSKRKFSSLCKKCSKDPRGYSTIKVPEDLDNGVIRLR